MDAQELYRHARERVKKRKKFYSHVVTWVVMSVFFILLNLVTTDYFWAIFPILGWGIGVAFHGIQVFTNEWEDAEIDREYERLVKKRKAFQPEESDLEDGEISLDDHDFV